MDVTCERCSTEYEFDDALVSERGTTVKCTNCGHQFKVRRTDGTSSAERWLVRTVDGRELNFNALRELQAAITNSRISKDDVLSRDNSRPRRLGSIAELEPFFANAGGPLIPSTAPGLGVQAPRARIATPAGLGVMSSTVPYRNEGSVAIPLPIVPGRRPAHEGGAASEGAESAAMPPLAPRKPAVFQTNAAPAVNVSPIAVPTPRQDAGYDIGRAATLPGVVVTPNDAPPVPQAGPARASDNDFGNTRPSAQPPGAPIFAGAAADLGRPQIPDDAPTQRRAVPLPSEGDEAPMASGRRQLGQSPEMRTMPLPVTPTPTDVRASYIHDDHHGPSTEPRFSSLTPSKQTGRARWIAGFVVLGMLAFTTIAVGRRYLSAGPRPSAGPAAPDVRVSALLQDSEKSLQDGDLEIAKELIDKASVLAENDPRVAIQQARLAVVRGDVAWLRVRLLRGDDAGASDDPAAKKELEVAADRARKAAERAAGLAPTDPAVIRARIDALRLSGDTAGARKLVGGLGVSSSQPESAVVLAALDLSEDKPDWRTVIERLRSAAGSEQNLGRARALLVYAIARSGGGTEARTELDRLALLPHPHPLLPQLRAFVDKASGKAVDVGALPNAASAKAEPKPDRPSGSGDSGTSTARPKSGDKPSKGGKQGDGRVPDDYVFPGSVDTSDLPGHAAPPKPSSEPGPAPAPAPGPAQDKSDLPGGKP